MGRRDFLDNAFWRSLTNEFAGRPRRRIVALDGNANAVRYAQVEVLLGPDKALPLGNLLLVSVLGLAAWLPILMVVGYR